MPKIILSEKAKAMLVKARAENKKCVIVNDLMINWDGLRWVMTSAHTGQEFEVVSKHEVRQTINFKL